MIILDLLALPFLWIAWLLSPHFRGEWSLHQRNIEDIQMLVNQLEKTQAANRHLKERSQRLQEDVRLAGQTVSELSAKLGEIEAVIYGHSVPRHGEPDLFFMEEPHEEVPAFHPQHHDDREQLPLRL